MENRAKRETPPSTKPPWILGLMMIIVGLVLVFSRLFYIEYKGEIFYVDDSLVGLISRAILIVGGIIMILLRKRGNYVAVGMYALTLGLSRIIRSIPGLLEPYVGGFAELNFYASLIFTVIGANLFYSGYNHLTVKTRNPTSMKYTAMALLAVYIIYVLYTYYSGGDVLYLVLSDINMLAYLPLYAGLLIVLYTREVIENNPIGRIATFTSSVASSSYVGDNITISESDSKVIEEGFGDCNSWAEYVVGGVPLRENSIVFHTLSGEKDVILQKWSDSDGLYLSLVNDKRDSFIGGQRMRAIGYDIRNGTMYLKDEMGTCAIMAIGGDS